MGTRKHQRIKMVLAALAMAAIIAFPVCAGAAPITSTLNDGYRAQLIEEPFLVGRYRFNYTGNTTYNQYWSADAKGQYTQGKYSDEPTNDLEGQRGKEGGQAAAKAAAKALGMTPNPKSITNSSTAELKQSSGASRIAKAFLVWQSRSDSTEEIALVAPDGEAKAYGPKESYVDRREWTDQEKKIQRKYSSLYCHYQDVTKFVQEKGYGKYSVCNIPVWKPDRENGGESMASWELIIIEEGKNFPVRALMLRLASVFNQDTNLNAWDVKETLSFRTGIETPSDTKDNSVTGQLFYMASVSSVTEGKLQASVHFGRADQKGDGYRYTVDKSSHGGMERGAERVGTENTCIRGNLENFKACETKTDGENKTTTVRFGFDADSVTLNLATEKWMSFFLFGLAVDVAQPDLVSEQTTKVNSSTSVTVAGKVVNQSRQRDTGFYDGNLSVALDSALTAQKATLTCYDAQGKKCHTVSGKGIGSGTVTFDGDEKNKIMCKAKGSFLVYEIECSADPAGKKKKFNNSHALNGKIYAKKFETGVDAFFTEASSSGTPMYTLTLLAGDNISGVSVKNPAASGKTVQKDYLYGASVEAAAEWNVGCEFERWESVGLPGEKAVTENPYSFQMPNQNVTLTAYGKKLYYTLTLTAGTGIQSVSGGGRYPAGQKVSISAEQKPGYHWKNWSGNFGNALTDNLAETPLTMPAHNVEAVANGEANTYTIRFEPNGGSGTIQEIITSYDQDVTLPDGAAAYVKYTLDGNNVTEDVVSGVLSQKMLFSGEESGEDAADAERAEETLKTAPGVADRTAYPSVFLGWAVKENKEELRPQWRAGETVRNLTEEENGIVTLYAVWDDCPWIEAQDLYYSLEQAKSGHITEEEILSYAKAVDREDGSPIAPGVNPSVKNPSQKTSFTIPDYQAGEFTGMTGDAAVSENLTVVDGSGNTYRKQIMVYVADTAPRKVTPKGATRFINEFYYEQPEECGGLPEDSPWKTDPAYRAAILEAFSNLKNNTPKLRFYFSHETILEMKEFIKKRGIGNSKEERALRLFWDTFLEPDRGQEKNR